MEEAARSSAYIPFLLGNLYFDKRWWSVAMDHYSVAIKKNGGYRTNATLNRNVITMLGQHEDPQKATNFLRARSASPAGLPAGGRRSTTRIRFGSRPSGLTVASATAPAANRVADERALTEGARIHKISRSLSTAQDP